MAAGPWSASGDAVLDNLAAGPGASGGGVLLVGRKAGVALRSITIAGNVAPVGAGIAEQPGGGPPVVGTISTSVISGNDLPSGTEQDCAAVGSGAALFLVSGGGNVVGDETCGLASPR